MFVKLNEALRRAVADSARRLRIAGSCSTNSGNAPGTGTASTTTSLGNGGTVELAPAAGRPVFDIRAGIIADQAALRALPVALPMAKARTAKKRPPIQRAFFQ